MTKPEKDDTIPTEKMLKSDLVLELNKARQLNSKNASRLEKAQTANKAAADIIEQMQGNKLTLQDAFDQQVRDNNRMDSEKEALEKVIEQQNQTLTEAQAKIDTIPVYLRQLAERAIEVKTLEGVITRLAYGDKNGIDTRTG